MRKILKVSFSPIAGIKLRINRRKLRIVSVIIRRIAQKRARISPKRAKTGSHGRGSPVLINTNNTNKSYNRTYTNSTYNTYNISNNRTNRSPTINPNISQNPIESKVIGYTVYKVYASI